MKSLRTTSALLALSLAAVTTIQIAASAQANRPPNQYRGTSNIRRPAPKNYLEDLKAITDALAKRMKARITVDPLLFVAAPPKVPAETATIDEAMTALAGQIKGAAWRKVYLSTAAGLIPPADRLAASVRALDLLDQSGIVLENPVTNRATTYVKNYPIPQNFADALAAQQFTTDPIYVLYNTNPNAAPNITPEDRFLQLQREQMNMMMQMSPDQMANAMQQGMQLYMNLDPQTRAQFMGQMMQAGMQMWQNMSPEMRQEMFSQMGQMFGGGGRRP